MRAASLAVRCLGLAASLLVFSTCSGAQPLPSPPGPVPADAASSADAPLPLPIFDHKVFDCRQAVVVVEYQGAKPDIKRCLSLAGAPDCLVEQAGQYNPATVACLARDLGADANAAVLAGSASSVDVAVAASARDFINSQLLGYK